MTIVKLTTQIVKMTNIFSQNDYKEVNMKIGDIVPVPMYIGAAHNKPVHLPARVIQIFPKGHIGVMYLCENLKSHFRTCIVVPPPPRFQPDPAQDRDRVQRWSKETHHNALEVEYEPKTYQKRTHDKQEELKERYTPFLEHIGLDPTRARSISQLRSLAHYRGYNPDEIEEGVYKWL